MRGAETGWGEEDTTWGKTRTSLRGQPAQGAPGTSENQFCLWACDSRSRTAQIPPSRKVALSSREECGWRTVSSCQLLPGASQPPGAVWPPVRPLAEVGYVQTLSSWGGQRARRLGLTGVFLGAVFLLAQSTLLGRRRCLGQFHPAPTPASPLPFRRC